jgi:hypothetical protein
MPPLRDYLRSVLNQVPNNSGAAKHISGMLDRIE